MGEPAGDDGVSGELAHVAAGELPDLGRDAVLLHQRLLGEVELQRVVRGQRDVEAARQVVRQRGPVVVQEERVVGQRPGIIFSQTAATSRYRSGNGGRVSTGTLAVQRRDFPSQCSALVCSQC